MTAHGLLTNLAASLALSSRNHPPIHRQANAAHTLQHTNGVHSSDLFTCRKSLSRFIVYFTYDIQLQA